METKPTHFLDKTYNPILQAAYALGFALVTMFILQMVKWSGAMVINNRTFWILAGTAILTFALFNSVISLSTKDMNKYWVQSTASYAVLMVACGGLAYLFSSMTIKQAGSFRWIFMVLTFGYLLFLSMMRFMRKIVQIAQKEDDSWQKRTK
jgi:beta-lactamase regulating signal transducer with metallopeptidase domain